jgi:hypothetical protein
MAAFTGLVGEVLAEPLYFAAFSLCVALGAVFKEFLMSFVIEFDPSLQFDYIRSKSTSGEYGQDKHGDKLCFHDGSFFGEGSGRVP